MLFSIITFGCKTNQYESQAIREELLAAGHAETADPARAETLLINTCTVTGRADATWRHAAVRARRENPGVRIFLLGCAVTANPAAAADNFAKLGIAVEHVFRNREKGAVSAYFAGNPPRENRPGGADDNFSLRVNAFSGHTRAFLKIQDGCDNRCSYCIIPTARGRGRSRPAGEILDEASRLADNGYLEIVLTGINIGAYNDAGLRLSGLIRRLAAVPGLLRLRLGSVEPQEVTDDLLAAMREKPNICHHLHLPLQSGAAETLRRMNRKYTLEQFTDTLARVRAALDRPAVTTDIITGFPGETDAQAAETLRTVRAAGFARAHIFLFSARAGTPAAAMKPTHPQLVEDRRRELNAVCEETAAAYARSLVGGKEAVLVETLTAGGAEGYGERYLRTRIAGAGADFRKKIMAVRITGAAGCELTATPLNEESL